MKKHPNKGSCYFEIPNIQQITMVPAQMLFVPSNKHPDGRYKKVSQHGEFASPLNVNLAREHLPASANMNAFVHLGTNL